MNIIENLEEYGKKILAGYKNMAQKAGIEYVTTRLDNGSPKIKIPKTIAPEIGADLIICGATGHNAVERFFIGSVLENITRYAKVDVLVVRC
ncbi:universal stress protein [Salinibacillus xinjiangensis]|uniref:universal stress protein n=1 Tax=Salinibacillus xinjiangensis TaxID=1229268 RepID=UPI002B27763F|nr:universal stress protein [Salinibacillus xinjiangensis]